MPRRLPKSRITPALMGALMLGLAGPAVAADGVVEINQARALSGGVTPGDTPGFPVTLTEPGSYRLTSNLDVSAVASPENVTAISVATGDVHIDLGGFSVRGTTTCTGALPAASLTCAPVGSGRGINASNRERVSVTNGSVQGMGDTGVYCGKGCDLTHLHVAHCGSSGITAADGSVIRENTLYRNRVNGVSFTSVGGLNIQGNTAIENGDSGIWSGSGDLVEGNVARGNHNKGLFLNGSALARGNTATGNGSDGIYASQGALVVNNVANSNGGFGLAFSHAAVPYEGNVVRGNTGGTVSGGTPMGLNFCNAGTTCP